MCVIRILVVGFVVVVVDMFCCFLSVECQTAQGPGLHKKAVRKYDVCVCA